ncbi:hypothetical protein KAX02_00380 [candidate division WOR-3 bacterium]|nr:hypothetical protein [candidate division WOR-3 bacterium]
MKIEEFNKLADEIFDRCTSALHVKGKGYSVDKDKLHNFKRAANMENCSTQKALIGMWAKHVVSILDIADNNVPYNAATIEEKVTDGINYLVLFEAIMKEQMTKICTDESEKVLKVCECKCQTCHGSG